MNRHLTEVDRFIAAARAAIAAQRAMLEGMDPDSPEASDSRELLTMSDLAPTLPGGHSAIDSG